MTQTARDHSPGTVPERHQLPSQVWQGRYRIAFGQCDPAGIVYTPRFYEILNRAVEDWFGQALGIDYYEVISARRTGLGYVAIDTIFSAPCMMGDEIDIFVEVVAVGNSSYQLRAHIFRDDTRLLLANLVTVTTNLIDHRKQLIPQDIRDALVRYQEACLAVQAGD